MGHRYVVVQTMLDLLVTKKIGFNEFLVTKIFFESTRVRKSSGKGLRYKFKKEISTVKTVVLSYLVKGFNYFTHFLPLYPFSIDFNN